MKEDIEIPTLNADVLGYLKTSDGLVILHKSIPETFDIARKMLEILDKKVKNNVEWP